MKTRTQNLKRSLVRIWVGGQPCGSGFVAGTRGLVITCFHVVQHVAPHPSGPPQILISVSSAIEVETQGGRKLPATPHPNCLNNGLEPAIAADFMVLSVPMLEVPALAIGAYDAVDEGDDIYLGGFPLAIQQPVVARGLLSTKWRAPAHLVQSQERDVAWLDVTMNKGNSGGPVIRLGKSEAEDQVIGIASFGLNPFAAEMERVIQIASNFPGGSALMGVEMGPFFTTVGHALVSNSLGVSGCVSIDYAKKALP